MFWTAGAALLQDRPVLVRPADVAALRLLMGVRGQPSPLVVEVVPNGEPRPELIQLLAVSAQGVMGRVPALGVSELREYSRRLVDPHIRAIFNSVADVVEACHAFEPNTLLDRIDTLEEETKTLEKVRPGSSPPRLLSVLALARQIAFSVLVPMVHGEAYVHPNNQPVHRNWWTKNPTLKTACDECLQSMHREFSSSPPLDIRPLYEWLNAVRANLLKLNKAVGTSHADVLRQAGALCAGIADRNFAEARLSLALIYLHRAADWVLKAKCSDTGLIDFRSAGGGYVHQPHLPIGVLESLRQLRGVVSLHGIDSPLEELNKWRNNAVQTHHLSTCPPADAVALYQDIRGKLRHLTNAAFDPASAALSAPLPLNPMTLLDGDGSVRASFRTH